MLKKTPRQRLTGSIVSSKLVDPSALNGPVPMTIAGKQVGFPAGSTGAYQIVKPQGGRGIPLLHVLVPGEQTPRTYSPSGASLIETIHGGPMAEHIKKKHFPEVKPG
jgi:hypothetical protein